jgi:hypothetical protein
MGTIPSDVAMTNPTNTLDRSGCDKYVVDDLPHPVKFWMTVVPIGNAIIMFLSVGAWTTLPKLPSGSIHLAKKIDSHKPFMTSSNGRKKGLHVLLLMVAYL